MLLTSLSDLPQLSNFQTVSVHVKVIKVKQLTKQEYTIADVTGTSTIVAWEDNCGILQEGQSYKLEGLNVRTFQNNKYLSIPREGFKIIEIDDIKEVASTPTTVENEHKLIHTIIVGVKHLDMYNACYSCRGKVVATSNGVRDCTRCSTTQRINSCQQRHTARLDLQSQGIIKTVTAFSPILEDFCKGEVTKLNLLTCNPFTAILSESMPSLIRLKLLNFISMLYPTLPHIL